jgi:hypothetical protein
LNCVAAKAKLYRVPERKKIDVTVDEESKIYKFSRVILRNTLVAGGYDVGQIKSFIGSKSDLLEKYMK